MAYVPKPGSFSLFKNDRKEKDSHPDYKGDGLDLNGKAVWVSAWIKEGSKGKFMSCSMQEKQSKTTTPQPRVTDDLPDDLPF